MFVAKKTKRNQAYLCFSFEMCSFVNQEIHNFGTSYSSGPVQWHVAFLNTPYCMF